MLSLVPSPSGHIFPPRQDLSILDRWRMGWWYPRVTGAGTFVPTALCTHPGHGFLRRGRWPELGFPRCHRDPGMPPLQRVPCLMLCSPLSLFVFLSFFLSPAAGGAAPGREGRMVVLSLVLGLSEQDDFANIPDLQPAGTQPPNQPNAQGDKRYERGTRTVPQEEEEETRASPRVEEEEEEEEVECEGWSGTGWPSRAR